MPDAAEALSARPELKQSAAQLDAARSNRQGAIYGRAHGNYGMRFAYVKPTASKKDGRAVVVYELERAQVDRQLAALRQIAIRLERFLNLFTPDLLCAVWRSRVPLGAVVANGFGIPAA